MPQSVTYNMDCVEFMRSLPDNTFSLAVCDPPYGLNEAGAGTKSSGKIGTRAFAKQDIGKLWDIAPSEEYFNELFRISIHQIIWGGNYFRLPPCRCFVVWDKKQPFKNFSACEYAWTSFIAPAKLFRFDNRYSGKIHPTQKPVELYDYLFKEFAEAGWSVIDPNLGSGSSRISAWRNGLDFVGIELNKQYYEEQEERFNREAKGIFRTADGKTLRQLNLFE